MSTASLAWFARHELRLSWRDMLSMLTAGRRGREPILVAMTIVFIAFMHGFAFLILRQTGPIGIRPDLATLIAVTATMLLSGSAMLSQAMENVTRAFYSRSDLELILSSPAPVQRIFAVRIGAIALSVGTMSLFITGPFIDVLVLRDGWRWLGAYGVILSIALVATALAVLATLALFDAIGPKRTRFRGAGCGSNHRCCLCDRHPARRHALHRHAVTHGVSSFAGGRRTCAGYSELCLVASTRRTR